MSLKDEIAILPPKQRRFILFRIADVEAEASRLLTGIKKSTYNDWCSQERFITLYRRRDEFAASFKEEAIKLLRRDNQLAAVLMEEKIIAKMRAEIDSGEYNLIRTNLAKEVYTRLISELDVPEPTTIMSWEQRVQNLFTGAPPMPAVTGTPPVLLSEVTNAQYAETISSEEVQSEESSNESESEQAKD